MDSPAQEITRLMEEDGFEAPQYGMPEGEAMELILNYIKKLRERGTHARTIRINDRNYITDNIGPDWYAKDGVYSIPHVWIRPGR